MGSPMAGANARQVIFYRGAEHEPEHERISHHEIARRIARLMGLEFGGEFRAAPTGSPTTPLYVVPKQTLTDPDETRRLGITDEEDLFGGFVPYPFMATKAISHPLVGAGAAAPEGWSGEFTDRVRDSVLEGFTVFSPEDALTAGKRMLGHGSVRIKAVRATAGRGQETVTDVQTLSRNLDAQNREEIANHGLVLEAFLDDVTTYSVGQVRLAGQIATYYGTQRLTSDNEGTEVYGGSDLVVVRGDFTDLLRLNLGEAARHAVAQAQVYDCAALDCFEGFFASRRNYDVARGLDSRGRLRSGVLEQSWRIGGASSAEIAALEAFAADAELMVIRASSHEVFGESAAVPEGATVLYRGNDAELGFITKYVMLEPELAGQD